MLLLLFADERRGTLICSQISQIKQIDLTYNIGSAIQETHYLHFDLLGFDPHSVLVSIMRKKYYFFGAK